MKATFFLGAVLMTATAGWGAPETPVLVLRVYDLTGMSPSELAGAVHETEHIFQTAGIHLSWTTGNPSAPEASLLDQSVPDSPVPLRRIIVVRIVSTAGPALPAEVLGRALPFAASGTQVTVFLDHIRSSAKQSAVPVPALIGHVLAHELGHVLLRSEVDSHQSAGVMCGEWGPSEYDRIRHGALRFTHFQTLALQRTILDGLSGDYVSYLARR
jgi:hypothetical protein